MGSEYAAIGVAGRCKAPGRAAYTLADEELVAVLVSRRQGRSFDMIARELRKWKTGQSVKKFLDRPDTRARAIELDSRVQDVLARIIVPAT